MNEDYKYSYRLTADEYERLFLERDALAEEFGAGGFMSLLQANPETWIKDHMHGRSMYDTGWYLVRTNTLIDWV